MKIILLVFVLLSNSISIGQNLSLKELLALRGIFVTEVYNDLINKHWAYLAEEKVQDGFGKTVYSFTGKTKDDYGFLTLSNSGDYIIDRLRLQFSNSETYTKYLKEIEVLGYSKFVSKKEENPLTEIFQNGQITIKLETERHQESVGPTTVYYIHIMNIEDFANE